MGIKISMQREVKERIRKEIIEAAQQYAEEYEIENYTDTASALNCVYAEFKDQFSWKIRQIGEYNAFIEWLKGLPLQFDYSYFDMRAKIEYWFDQSSEESSKYSDEQVDKLYWNLLTREFFALVKKFKVTGIIEPEDNIEIEPSDMDNILEESNIIDNDDETNWKKVLEDNRDAIEEKMVDLYRECEGTNQNVHKGLAIEPSGKLYTWTYVGNYSEPESTWNGTDLCITTFSAWDWTDCVQDLDSLALDYAGDQKKTLKMRIKEEKEKHMLGATTYEILINEFPSIFQTIKEIAIDEEINAYSEGVSALLDEIIRNVLEESTIVSNTVPEDIEDYYIPIEYEYVEDSDSDETRPYVDYFKHRIYLDEVMRLNTPEVIDGIEYHGYKGISNSMSYMIHINPSGDAVIVRESGADKLYNPNKKEIAVEESNIIDNDNMKMSDVDFQELYNAVNNEKKKIDEKYFYKYMNKGNKNKTFDGSGLKIFKLLPDGLKLRLYNKWKKYLSVDEINSALDKVAEKLLSNNNALEESNIIDNDDREGKIKDIIDKLKILNELWWKSEEYHDNNALQKHNKLEQEIRKNMSDIGLDFDSIGAEYEDMISKLQKMMDMDNIMNNEVKYSSDLRDHAIYFCNIINFIKKEMIPRYDKTSNEYLELIKLTDDLEENKQVYYKYFVNNIEKR